MGLKNSARTVQKKAIPSVISMALQNFFLVHYASAVSIVLPLTFLFAFASLWHLKAHLLSKAVLLAEKHLYKTHTGVYFQEEALMGCRTYQWGSK